MVMMLLATAALYAPSLGYGFLWDDPIWFRRVVGKAWWQLFAPMPDNQFYRPGTLLIIRLFARPDGTFPIVAMHAFQVALHLLNTVLVARLARLLGADEGVASLTASFFAAFPLAAQAVVWAAPQQPWVVALMLLVLNLYPSVQRRGGWRWPGLMALFLFAMMVQESAVQMLPFLFLFDLRRDGSFRKTAGRPQLWGFVAVAVLYLALWFAVPKHHGETGISFEPRVALYLLQAPAWPLLGRVGGATVPISLLPWLEGGVLAALGAWLAWRRRSFFFVWGAGWFAAQLFSAWAGLRESYVFLSPRLFYLAAPGLALLWASALAPRRVSGRALLALLAASSMLAQGVRLIRRQERDYAFGLVPLRQAVERLCRDGRGGSFLFVNFPDRYRERSPIFPLGYWGVTLAPIHVPLGHFADVTCARRAQTLSFSVPALDLQAREAMPWQVDMRGSPVDLPVIHRHLLDGATLYVTRYEGERMRLEAGGRVLPAAEGEALARFGDVAALLDLRADEEGLRLRWRSLGGAGSEIVVFVHLLDEEGRLVAQDDGAPASSLLPFALWSPGEVVEEWRHFAIDTGRRVPPGRYVVEVGLYDWRTGERLDAVGRGGEPLPNGAWRTVLVVP